MNGGDRWRRSIRQVSRSTIYKQLVSLSFSLLSLLTNSQQMRVPSTKLTFSSHVSFSPLSFYRLLSSLLFLPPSTLNYDTSTVVVVVVLALWTRTSNSNDSTRSSRPRVPFPPRSAPTISGTSPAPVTFPPSAAAPARFLPSRSSRHLFSTARGPMTARRRRQGRSAWEGVTRE